VLYSKKIMFKKLGLFLVVLMTVTLLLPMVTAGVAGAADSPANSAVHFLRNDYAKNGINNSEAGVGSYALYVLNRAGVDVSTWVYDNVNLEDAVISAVWRERQFRRRITPCSFYTTTTQITG